ncbi:MAG: hypothetical protein Q7S09_01185 [bacterium]|nr:hypothetical protein [bacterium]
MSQKPFVDPAFPPVRRECPITGKWVVINPARSLRFKNERKGFPPAYENLPEHKENCPFCLGNEEQTPPELFRIPAEKELWRLRVTDNMYPIFTLEATGEGGARGASRILVPTPKHNECLSALTLGDITNLFDGFLNSYTNLREARNKDMGEKLFPSGQCIPFINYGREAGASLEHLHAQFSVSAVVSTRLRNLQSRTHKHWLYESRCLICEVIGRDVAEGRLVADDNYFVAAVPYAASVPWHVRIFPKEHTSSFASDLAVGARSYALAKLLRDILRRIKFSLQRPQDALVLAGDPPYNFIISTSRFDGDHDSGSFHWFCDIVPRTTKPAGLEWATDEDVNPNLPESDAEILRNARVES